MKYKCLTLAAALLTVAACASPAPPLNWRGTAETRWSATYYTAAGESTPFTLIMMRLEAQGPARLLLLSPFGALLGDCVLENGRRHCQGPRPAAGLAGKIAAAVGAMLQNEEIFLTRPDSEYSAPTGWRLSLKKMERNTWPEK